MCLLLHSFNDVGSDGDISVDFGTVALIMMISYRILLQRVLWRSFKSSSSVGSFLTLYSGVVVVVLLLLLLFI